MARMRQHPPGASRTAFTRLLVPVDLSEKHDRPLRIALGLARHGGARVMLLHAVQPLAGTTDDELRAFYARLRSTAEHTLARLARPFARAGVRVRTEVVLGEPAVEIVRAAEAQRADLIVMGSHRVDPRRRGQGFGTTSYKVGVLCLCPVLLVK